MKTIEQKAKKVPAIRFAGFEDEWVEKKILDLLIQTITDGPHETPDLVEDGIPFISVDAIVDNKIDFSRKRGFITEEYDFECCKKYKPELYDVYLVKSGSTVGKTAIVETTDRFNIWSPLAAMRCGDKTSPYFLYFLLQTKNLQNQVFDKASHGTQPNLSMRELEKFLAIVAQRTDEQNQIGSLLKKMEHLVYLEQKKYDKLTQVKMSMLEKMFPKEGMTVPEIRFAGFTGEWDEKKFGEIVVIERGGSPRPIEKFITKNENGLNWVKIGDAPEQGNYITCTAEKIIPEGLSKTREVHPGDLILSNSMSFGRPYIMAIDGCIHDGWLLIRNSKGIFDLNFLCTLLGTENMLSQYKAMAAGSTVNNLNKELVARTFVSYPKIDEQKKIGSYFSHLDSLISLQHRKLEKLKNIKKSLLEKMFV